MNTLPSLLFSNETLEAELEAFCASDPAFQIAQQQFYEAAHALAQQVSFELYDAFETRFSTYLYRTADLYYLFGLGLRQELLQALKD